MPQKMKGKELHAHVRALLAWMEEDDRRVLCRCQKTGFLIRRSGSTSVSPSLDIYSVTTTVINLNKLSIPIQIEDTEDRGVKTLGLIDSSAGGKFINQNYAKRMGFKTHKLEKPLQDYNVDGTKNK